MSIQAIKQEESNEYKIHDRSVDNVEAVGVCPSHAIGVESTPVSGVAHNPVNTIVIIRHGQKSVNGLRRASLRLITLRVFVASV